MYAMVIAHNEGQAVERLALNTVGTQAQAWAHADVWSRRHGHRAYDTDKCGYFAYVDRVDRPVCPQFRVNVARVR